MSEIEYRELAAEEKLYTLSRKDNRYEYIKTARMA